MDNLPDEILQQIILYCDLDDINNLISVNKLFGTLCSDSYLWYRLIERRFVKLHEY